ncbi:hypothetical protein GP486_002610 [Trichoglossum hirsutum]|uniref:Uncharacterized protein n=1 Tax=Trichoglossum hirsutum TaxID=265104 RepID=A0A9P8RRY2_9PEZI|nr:hypothetical protein GP486_002610 [Trichoglossum hirsutum]
MILGRKWFVETSILVDCKNRILTTIKKNLESAVSSQYHQADVDRRDQAMAALEIIKPYTILQQLASEQPMWKKDQHEQYRKMGNVTNVDFSCLESICRMLLLKQF